MAKKKVVKKPEEKKEVVKCEYTLRDRVAMIVNGYDKVVTVTDIVDAINAEIESEGYDEKPKDRKNVRTALCNLLAENEIQRSGRGEYVAVGVVVEAKPVEKSTVVKKIGVKKVTKKEAPVAKKEEETPEVKLTDLTVKELQGMAIAYVVPGYKKMKKDDLIAAVKKALSAEKRRLTNAAKKAAKDAEVEKKAAPKAEKKAAPKAEKKAAPKAEKKAAPKAGPKVSKEVAVEEAYNGHKVGCQCPVCRSKRNKALATIPTEPETQKVVDEDETPSVPLKNRCVACEGTGNASSGKACKPCGGTGVKQEQIDSDPPPAKAKKATPKAKAPVAKKSVKKDEDSSGLIEGETKMYLKQETKNLKGDVFPIGKEVQFEANSKSHGGYAVVSVKDDNGRRVTLGVPLGSLSKDPISEVESAG